MRAERGLSMKQLAFPGCSAAYVCRIEAGERVPSPRILAELARRLGVTTAELAGRAEGGSIAPARIGLAEMAVRMGSDDAADILEALVEEARACGDLHAQSRAVEGLGQLAIDERDDERAVALLEEARALEPAATARVRPGLYESLGRAYAGTGDLSRAISVLRAALEETRRPPVDVRGVIRFGVYLASAYTDQGRFADAEAVLADVLDVEAAIADPIARTRVLWAMARTYAEQGRLRLAERYMGEVVARLEAAEHTLLLGRAHAVLGGIMVDQRRPARPSAHLERAGELMQAAGRNAGAGHAQRRPRPRRAACRRCRGRPRGRPPGALRDGRDRARRGRQRHAGAGSGGASRRRPRRGPVPVPERDRSARAHRGAPLRRRGKPGARARRAARRATCEPRSQPSGTAWGRSTGVSPKRRRAMASRIDETPGAGSVGALAGCRDPRDRAAARSAAAGSSASIRRSELDRRHAMERLLRAEEQERRRLAAELHDDTVQVLAACLVALDRLEQTVETADREPDRDRRHRRPAHARSGHRPHPRG